MQSAVQQEPHERDSDRDNNEHAPTPRHACTQPLETNEFFLYKYKICMYT